MSVPEELAPDGIEPLVGWRYWGCDSGWLTSINRFSTWPAGRPTRARCSWAAAHGPEVPHESCRCGVYAVDDLDTLRQVADPLEGACGRTRTVVVGTVAVWGRIVPGEWGWRGELAYPVHLWVVRETAGACDEPEMLAAGLETVYRVPAGVCDGAWALPQDARLPPDADAAAMAAEAWDLSHRLDRLADAAALGASAYEQELRRFFSSTGLTGRAPRDGGGPPGRPPPSGGRLKNL